MPATPGVAIIGDKTRSKARSHAHRTARGFFDLPLVTDMRIICGRNATGIEAAAKRRGGAEAIEEDLTRLETAGLPVERQEPGIAVRDPWSNGIRLSAHAALPLTHLMSW